MMRLWVESYSRATPVSSSAVVSVVTHALLIAAAVASTSRPANMEADWIENRAYYLPPPNRMPAQQASGETIKYVELSPEGVGAGFGAGELGSDRPVVHELSENPGDLGRDTTSSEKAPQLAGADSVFTQLEVDSTVSRYPGSAAPAYPVEMLKQGLQGSVVTQYVVDTPAGRVTVYVQNLEPGAAVAKPGDPITIGFDPEATFVVELSEEEMA